MDATEYMDEPAVLDAKIDVLVGLIEKSKNMIVYTGAGISTGAGINDYASKAEKSVALKPKTANYLTAQPTKAHKVLAALEKKGHLKYWIQQNHDGLAQKAGYPQAKINEIHGSWFHRENPVVKMSGQLRPDLYKLMLEWEEQTDFCLAMGSTLSGMNADRVAVTPAEKAMDGEGVGLAIINLQRTQHDDKCQLRIFADLDTAMTLLAQKMKIRARW
jgi:NAD-dependent SIR2 family protein deacetylase